MFCYANAEIAKADQNDEILRFVEFWRARTGKLPRELIFDSKLTTYANLEPAWVSRRLHTLEVRMESWTRTRRRSATRPS